MTNNFDPDFTIELPPIHTFQRPFWAYDKLPDGWNILRRLLFGNTHAAMEALLEYGDQHLTSVELNRILRPFTIHPGVHCILMHANRGRTAVQLAEWYQAWEDRIFMEYCERVRQQERASLGLRERLNSLMKG